MRHAYSCTVLFMNSTVPVSWDPLNEPSLSYQCPMHSDSMVSVITSLSVGMPGISLS